MSSLAESVRELLEEMTALCGQLLPLIATERQALINMDLDQLPRLAEAKTRLTEALVRKRDQAKRLVERLAAAGSAEPVTTIAQLLPFLPAEDRRTLSGPYLDYLAKAREVEKFNAHNRLLAEQGLKSTEHAMADLVTLMRGGPTTYQRPGAYPKPPDIPLGRHRREL